MDSLPQEILVNILSRLPIKPLLRCKSVCKSFLNLTLDPHLIETHLNYASSSHRDQNPSLILNTTVLNGTTQFRSQLHYTTLNLTKSYSHCDEVPFSTLNFKEFRVEGSCSGLLLLHHRTIDGYMLVINPCIGKLIEIPKLIIPSFASRWEIGIGFGFSPKTNEYKVVKVIDGPASYVFSLREGVWRAVGAPSFKISGFFKSDGCVCVNGGIHWPGYCQSRFILCFDVGNEVFCVIPYPTGKLQEGTDSLALFSGCLGLIECGRAENNCFNIWVMKDYNVRESWTRSVVINLNHIGWHCREVELLSVQKNGEVLMLHRNQALWVYDPQTMSLRKPNIVGLPSWFRAVCHVCSLVSPSGY